MFLNVPRARRILHEQGLDGLLAASAIPNVFYLCGIWRRADVAAAIPRDRPAAPGGTGRRVRRAKPPLPSG